MRLKPRYFMVPEDASPGGGSPPAGGAPAAQPTAATPAQGNAPAAPPFDTAAFARDVAAAVAPSVRDFVFAEMRKSGVLPKGGSAPASAGAESQPNAGVTAAPGAVDVEAIIERRENFAFELGRFDAPASGVSRARAAFKAENPADVNAWARAYATDMGWKERAAPSAATGTPNPTTAAGTAPATVTTNPAANAGAGGQKPFAASDTAPGGGTLTPGELIDVTKLTDEQRLQLGPEGIRAALDRAAEAGNQRDGRPRIPSVLRIPTKR